MHINSIQFGEEDPHTEFFNHATQKNNKAHKLSFDELIPPCKAKRRT